MVIELLVHGDSWVETEAKEMDFVDRLVDDQPVRIWSENDEMTLPEIAFQPAIAS